jgi:LysM repeat protein
MLALPSVGRRACSCLLVIGALVLAGSAHYTVRAGDTLSGIAAAHGVSASAVAAANGISDADLIHAGQSLDIPAGSGRAEASVDSGGGGHVVRPGETLSDIARRYGIGVADLAAANDVADVNVVIEGRRLRVPAPAAVVPAPRSVSSRADVGTLLEQTARDYGWNPAMVKALAMQESGWNNGWSRASAPSASCRYCPPPASSSRSASSGGPSTSAIRPTTWRPGSRSSTTSTA